MNALLLPERPADLIETEEPVRYVRIPLPIAGDIPPEEFFRPVEPRISQIERRRIAARAEIAGRLLHKARVEPSPIILGQDYNDRGHEYDYVQLPDGRRLAYSDIGDKRDPAIVAFHGNPVGRKDVWPRAIHNYQRGLRIITFDRPGYGDSTRDKGHTIWDSALDAQVLVRALGLGRFAISGRSGGGPAAMALAARMPEQVSSLSLLATVAPPKEMMADRFFNWTRGMSADNAEKYRLADQASIEDLEEIAMNHALDLQDDPYSFFKMLEPSLTTHDRRVLHGSGLRHLFMRAYDHGLAQYGVGWADDMHAISHDWGFSVKDIPDTMTVRIWHGQHDNHAPHAHAEWLARAITHARFDSVPFASHFDTFTAFPGILLWHRNLLLDEKEA